MSPDEAATLKPRSISHPDEAYHVKRRVEIVAAIEKAGSRSKAAVAMGISVQRICQLTSRYNIEISGKNRCKKYRFGDEELSISEWCRKLKMREESVRTRLKKGWDPEEAFFTPVGSPREEVIAKRKKRREEMIALFRECNGNRAAVCRRLGIAYPNIYGVISRNDIPKSEYNDARHNQHSKKKVDLRTSG
jgi:hypothetical protein